MNSQKYFSVIILGFSFILLGIGILIWGGNQSSDSFFFIFPFFFVGNPGPAGLLLILISIVFTCLFLYQLIKVQSGISPFGVETGLLCPKCKKELPLGASFCMHCGTAIHQRVDLENDDIR
ncbi:MAG: zinc ribbon domain-containing protein [Candidatus Thorarchaeota archaeon]